MKLNQSQSVLLRSIVTFFLLSCGLCISAQGLSKKDLIGKWQSVNSEKPMEMIFADTTTLYVKTDGNPALNNATLTFSIDSIKDHSLLLIHFPTGFTMKMILWVKTKDEIRLFAVDLMNYKDPLKEIPEETSKKIIIMKRSGGVI
jgi:hypothetical protein